MQKKINPHPSIHPSIYLPILPVLFIHPSIYPSIIRTCRHLLLGKNRCKKYCSNPSCRAGLVYRPPIMDVGWSRVSRYVKKRWSNQNYRRALMNTIESTYRPGWLMMRAPFPFSRIILLLPVDVSLFPAFSFRPSSTPPYYFLFFVLSYHSPHPSHILTVCLSVSLSLTHVYTHSFSLLPVI